MLLGNITTPFSRLKKFLIASKIFFIIYVFIQAHISIEMPDNHREIIMVSYCFCKAYARDC